MHLEQRAHPPSFAAGGSCAVSKAPAKSATTRAPSRMWTSDVGRHSLPLLARTLCAHFSAATQVLFSSPLPSLFSLLPSLSLSRARFFLASLCSRAHAPTHALCYPSSLISVLAHAQKTRALLAFFFLALSALALCTRVLSSLTHLHPSITLSQLFSLTVLFLQMGGGAQCVRVLFSLTVYCCCFLRMGGGACGVQCVCA